MNTCFGKEYSNTYDLFYEQKNYIAECDFLENLFKKHSLYPKSILDIGCGTGNHMIPLLDRGYKVSGIDQSKEMLRIASAKRPEIQNDLYQSDMTCFSLNEKFDLAISMFAVVSYLTDNKQLYDSLHCIKSHLNEGGAFIFDCWSGPAVLSKRPLQSHKIVTLPNGGECVRLSNPLLNIETNCVLNNFDFLFMDKHLYQIFNLSSISLKFKCENLDFCLMFILLYFFILLFIFNIKFLSLILHK